MNSKLINELGLGGANLSESDITTLNNLLSSFNSGGKMPKISAKDKNNLISKLSSVQTLDQIPKKELKNMNEDEKKIYKDELRNRLKNKCNEKKLLRTNNLNKKQTINSSINKIPEIPEIPENSNMLNMSNMSNMMSTMMSSIVNELDKNNLPEPEPKPVLAPESESVQTSESVQASESVPVPTPENLEDYINQ